MFKESESGVDLRNRQCGSEIGIGYNVSLKTFGLPYT